MLLKTVSCCFLEKQEARLKFKKMKLTRINTKT